MEVEHGHGTQRTARVEERGFDIGLYLYTLVSIYSGEPKY